LQVRDAVNAVTGAEAHLQEVVQRARAERDRILNAAAGEAWETIYDDVLLLDQAGNDEARDTILTRIDEQLEQKAAGESGEIIKQAQNERERILLETRARANEFLALLEPYQANPELLRQQLLRDMLRRLNAESNIKKWFLPPGDKAVTLWLNPDPEDFRREARERAQAKIEARQAQRGR
jgi:vacuolar-type H+-ATPase subunit H